MMKLEKNKWKIVNLGEVCEINIGRTPERKIARYWTGGNTWLSISDFNGSKYLSKSKEEISDVAIRECNCKIVPSQTILFTFKLTIGKIAITEKPLYTNEAIASLPIKDKSRLTIDYLYYVLQIIDFVSFADKAVKGMTLNKAKLNLIKIPLPPLDEQQRIVELFQSLEEVILNVEEQIKKITILKKQLINGLGGKEPVFGNLLAGNNYLPCKFSDLCECIEHHDKNPLQNGISRFVGLENIESDNFSLQGFGNIENGTTFTKRFNTGDVLFGKRRAYLRKVAVADFDGLCSSDILVFRAKPSMILPELLPYYASSETFFLHAINTSAGSLSPRTKWRDLAGFELALPDLQTQTKIVDVFGKLENTLTLLKTQKQTLINLKQKLLNEILT